MQLPAVQRPRMSLGQYYYDVVMQLSNTYLCNLTDITDWDLIKIIAMPFLSDSVSHAFSHNFFGPLIPTAAAVTP